MKKKKNKVEEIEILDFDDCSQEKKPENKIKQVKTFLSDKKNKALVKLIIYTVFIGFVAIYVRMLSGSNSQQQVTPVNPSNTSVKEEEKLPITVTDKLKKLNDDKDYEFTLHYYSRGNGVNEYMLSGVVSNGTLKVLYNDTEYLYDENGFYTMDNEKKIYVESGFVKEVPLYLSKNVYNYLLKSEYQYKTEDVNNNLKINSKIKISDFALVNNNVIENDEYIIIETLENKNSNNIDINLNMTNYYAFSDEAIKECKVEINFKY